jgi:hypothetical protein
MAMGASQTMTIAALAMALGAIAAGPAFADDAPGTSQPRKAKSDTARKICRVMIPTGSRMTSRICRTQAEWDKSMDKNQESLLRYQSTRETQYAQPGSN